MQAHQAKDFDRFAQAHLLGKNAAAQVTFGSCNDFFVGSHNPEPATDKAGPAV
jgi:hypothetical protein